MKQFFLKLWSVILAFFNKVKSMSETPYKPQKKEPLFVLREVQQAIRAGLSYRAIARATGLTKAEVKACKIINTGKFYFARGQASLNIHANQTLRAELFDPLTGQTSSPPSTPIFKSAPQAWGWLQGRRLMADFEAANKAPQLLTPGSYPTDYTPASH